MYTYLYIFITSLVFSLVFDWLQFINQFLKLYQQGRKKIDLCSERRETINQVYMKDDIFPYRP